MVYSFDLYFIVSSVVFCFFFFFNDTATTEIYTLSLHDALPILILLHAWTLAATFTSPPTFVAEHSTLPLRRLWRLRRSEEHTSELQSRQYLVCRLLLEKKKKSNTPIILTFEAQ